jgi:hypothetical protein
MRGGGRPLAVLAAVLTAALAGCGGDRREAPRAAARVSPAEPPHAARPLSRVLRIHTPEKRAAVVLMPGPGSVRVEIAGAGGPLAVEGYEFGRDWRYEGPGNRPLAKARTDGTVVRVSSPKGAPLWRIVASRHRIRLTRGHGDPRPYLLLRAGGGPAGGDAGSPLGREREAGRAERGQIVVRQGGELRGRVVFAGGRLRVRDGRGEVRFFARDDRLRPCYAILLLDEIPVEERAVLLAEMARLKS